MEGMLEEFEGRIFTVTLMRLGRVSFGALMDIVELNFLNGSLMTQGELNLFFENQILEGNSVWTVQELVDEIFSSEQSILENYPGNKFSVQEVEQVIAKINKHKAVSWDEID